jgi:flavorubredoxin
MNIALIICSESGNTMKLGELVRAKLSAKGHQVQLTKLATDKPIDTKKPLTEAEVAITNLPDVSSSDIVMVGGPVWALRPYAVVTKAIRELGKQINGKKVLPFVTHSFPWAWMTGNSSANTLRRIAASQGANIIGTGVLSRASAPKGKDERYEAAADRICGLIK